MAINTLVELNKLAGESPSLNCRAHLGDWSGAGENGANAAGIVSGKERGARVRVRPPTRLGNLNLNPAVPPVRFRTRITYVSRPARAPGASMALVTARECRLGLGLTQAAPGDGLECQFTVTGTRLSQVKSRTRLGV